MLVRYIDRFSSPWKTNEGLAWPACALLSSPTRNIYWDMPLFPAWRWSSTAAGAVTDFFFDHPALVMLAGKNVYWEVPLLPAWAWKLTVYFTYLFRRRAVTDFFWPACASYPREQNVYWEVPLLPAWAWKLTVYFTYLFRRRAVTDFFLTSLR